MVLDLKLKNLPVKEKVHILKLCILQLHLHLQLLLHPIHHQRLLNNLLLQEKDLHQKLLNILML